MAAYIPLIDGGGHAVVDEQDVPLISGFQWRVHKSPRGKSRYAKARSGRNIYMHRLIIGAPIGTAVDHKNGDGLDNRRCNLRLCTPSQNSANAARRRPVSGYRGVYPRDSWWVVRIGHDFQVVGKFASKVEAALFYDDLARTRWGEFARLNFPHEGELPAFPSPESAA